MRVAIVGPVEPFRSGISKHTTALARAMARRPGVLVKVVSFSRQYPALLFPGQSDRALDTAQPEDLDVESVIDSVNPLTWPLAVRRIQSFRPDLVIAPAWTFFLAPCFAFILGQLRRRGVPVVSMVHNVADHESGRVKAALSALQLKQASAYMTHTRELAAGITAVVPDARIEVLAHPVFDYPRARGLLPRRADLELLMFGLVRPYKGLDVLLRALSMSRKQSVRLSVVGEMWQGAGDVSKLIASLGLEQKVELVPHYVSDADAAEYFARADVVVLPYRSMTGSGVLPLAFYYGKPVAVSNLPGFLDLVSEGQTGWILPAGDAAAWAEAIDGRVSREAALTMTPSIQAARQRLSFDAFAQALLQVSKPLRVNQQHHRLER